MIVVYFLDGNSVYVVDKRGSICHSGDVYRIDTLNEGIAAMNANARTARRTVKQRSAQTRLTASLNRGRSLATHLLAAGVDADTAKGVANGLRSVAKRLHLEPVRVTRTRRTLNGRDGHGHRVQHFTTTQVRLLVAAYKPRKAEYRAATYKLAA